MEVESPLQKQETMSPYNKTLPPNAKQFREIEEAKKKMAIKNFMISKLEKQKVLRHQIQSSIDSMTSLPNEISGS